MHWHFNSLNEPRVTLLHQLLLYRVLKVNDDPKSVEFCNQRGDLMAGFDTNIHIIRHPNYLPRIYLYRMFCMQFPKQEKEDTVPLEENILQFLNQETVRKMKNAKSSYLMLAQV